jgi:hypothetical protein
MDRHLPAGASAHVEDVEEDEGLEDLPQIRGAHEPRDRTVAMAAGQVHDGALR